MDFLTIYIKIGTLISLKVTPIFSLTFRASCMHTASAPLSKPPWICTCQCSGPWPRPLSKLCLDWWNCSRCVSVVRNMKGSVFVSNLRSNLAVSPPPAGCGAHVSQAIPGCSRLCFSHHAAAAVTGPQRYRQCQGKSIHTQKTPHHWLFVYELSVHPSPCCEYIP